jgi:hypothetical protein
MELHNPTKLQNIQGRGMLAVSVAIIVPNLVDKKSVANFMDVRKLGTVQTSIEHKECSHVIKPRKNVEEG